MKSFNENDFLYELSIQPWPLINLCDDPDQCYELFSNMFLSVLQKHAPLKMKRVKRPIQPHWINTDILNAIKTRNFYHRKRNTSKYKEWRQRVRNLIFQSKSEFFNTHINSNTHNPKHLWNSLKQLSGQNKNVQNTYHMKNANNSIVKDPKAVANLFNETFCNIFQTNKDINTTQTFSDKLKSINDSKLINVERFSIPPVSTDFVLHHLNNLDSSKATGVDNINSKFLRMSASMIAPSLTHIFNCSINFHIVPNAFKIAKVIPIYKKGDKMEVLNYRPISILPTISLILEKHVNLHLKSFLESNNLIYNRQSGFRENHSCQTALIKLLDEWITAIDRNEIVGALLLDLSKAFDLVNHNILLNKLQNYGLNDKSIKWFSSYLSNRVQQTHISGCLSSPGQVLSGVPQGSVLGPTLFLIYINDLSLGLNNTTADIFADDTTISAFNTSLESVVNALSVDLTSIDNWCKENNMSINVSKSKVMYITSKHVNRQIADQMPEIPFKDSVINVSTCEKLLGVTISNTLTWDNHVNTVIKKCNSYLYLLSRIKLFLSIEIRKRFYNAYILPHFDFCCVIWGNCSAALEDILVKFQKRAARVILDKDYSTPSKHLFNELNWLTFPERVVFLKSIQIFKTLNGNAPEYLQTSFTFTSEIHSRLLRSTSNAQLYTPRPNTELFRTSFAFSGTSIWNSLPYHVKQSSSLKQFKVSYLKWFKSVNSQR